VYEGVAKVVAFLDARVGLAGGLGFSRKHFSWLVSCLCEHDHNNRRSRCSFQIMRQTCTQLRLASFKSFASEQIPVNLTNGGAADPDHAEIAGNSDRAAM
jgi:hypothetical protein